jgi:hypothetical protein
MENQVFFWAKAAEIMQKQLREMTRARFIIFPQKKGAKTFVETLRGLLFHLKDPAACDAMWKLVTSRSFRSHLSGKTVLLSCIFGCCVCNFVLRRDGITNLHTPFARAYQTLCLNCSLASAAKHAILDWTDSIFFLSSNRDRGEAVSGAAAVGSGGSGISKGKSFRKRIRASFRMKSMREKKKSVTATPNAPELNAGAAADTNPTGKKPMVLKDKRIRNLLTVAADSDTDTETEADS